MGKVILEKNEEEKHKTEPLRQIMGTALLLAEIMEVTLEKIGKYKNYKRKLSPAEDQHMKYMQSLHNRARVHREVELEFANAIIEGRPLLVDFRILDGAIHAIQNGADITKLRPRRLKRGK